ncbi:GntR family transcriptional regulator [Prosthecomicrobium pneumaticum]|uniref:DNA-binding GntR family transcriptional regulator n=1 Tax=Prosthecomicrobium pneumaticum TaxID=81895 RepID=A0A7W9L356_9HYPH|nr:GntR family transcriptional regulator [Prosthecomicrobium pneumaticum]MBB5754190.1 DNA-binding GntR family transcriptional regulator [Prosthecomicrobium pneumaticum]
MVKPNTRFKETANRLMALASEVGAGGALPSETALADRLGVSRTTVRAGLGRLAEAGILAVDGRAKAVKRAPRADEFFPEAETTSTAVLVERAFMAIIERGDFRPGHPVNELDFARRIGTSTSAVREFLMRFSRFRLIEKRPRGGWVLKGVTKSFATELADIREMYEYFSVRAFLELPKEHALWQKLDRLEARHHELAAAIDTRWPEFSDLDDAFHRTIHEASSNRFIHDFYDIISFIFHYHYQWKKQDERRRNASAIAEHLAYIDALRAGDRDRLTMAVSRHLASARTTLMRSVDEAADGPSGLPPSSTP